VRRAHQLGERCHASPGLCCVLSTGLPSVGLSISIRTQVPGVGVTSPHRSVAAPGGPTSEDVWREFGAQLRAFVHRRVADPQRAEDVLGEIVLRIHRKLGRVEDHEHLTRWVYRITRNAIVDEYRRAERERARERALPDDAAELVGEVVDEDDLTVLREPALCIPGRSGRRRRRAGDRR
jgi:hypothetical protein